MGFKLRSGNKPAFKMMGSTPYKVAPEVAGEGADKADPETKTGVQEAKDALKAAKQARKDSRKQNRKDDKRSLRRKKLILKIKRKKKLKEGLLKTKESV